MMSEPVQTGALHHIIKLLIFISGNKNEKLIYFNAVVYSVDQLACLVL